MLVTLGHIVIRQLMKWIGIVSTSRKVSAFYFLKEVDED